MKVRIDCDRRVNKTRTGYEGGWYYQEALPNERFEEYTDDYPPKSSREPTYAAIKAKAIADGHEISCGGWKHKMLSWNFTSHMLDYYNGWEVEDPEAEPLQRRVAFVKLEHTRRCGSDVESNVLCNAWDDIATVDFYQRDWTDDGIPFVHDGKTYWSGWWFATFAEKQRFLAWCAEQKQRVVNV